MNRWDHFKELTSNNVKLENIANDPTEDSDIIMKVIEKEIDAIKYKAFGKVKVRERKSDKLLEDLMVEKESLIRNKNGNNSQDSEEIDKRICEELKNKQKRNVERELQRLQIKKEKKGNAAVVFDLKGQITGKKKEIDEPSAIINPKSKKLVFNPAEIVKVCADYVEDLLTNKDPKEEYKEDFEWKRRAHNIRMEAIVDDGP